MPLRHRVLALGHIVDDELAELAVQRCVNDNIMIIDGRCDPKAVIVDFGADGKAMKIEISATIGTATRHEFLEHKRASCSGYCGQYSRAAWRLVKTPSTP
jgi:hypothetical protein